MLEVTPNPWLLGVTTGLLCHPPPPATTTKVLHSLFDIRVNSSAFCLTILGTSLDSIYPVEPQYCGLNSLAYRPSQMGGRGGSSDGLYEGLGEVHFKNTVCCDFFRLFSLP